MNGDNISDETLMAFADGELDAADAKRVADAIAADPALGARAEMFRTTRRLAREAFEPLAREPVPEALLARVKASIAARDMPSPNVVSMTKRRAAPAWQAALRGLPLAASIAAVAAGIGGYGLGRYLADAGSSSGLVAGEIPGEIRVALDTRPSGTEESGAIGRLKLIATFRAEDGRLCREFEEIMPEADTIMGVACRRRGQPWTVVFAVAAPAGGDGYAPASSVQILESYLSATGAGPALAPDEERAALGG